MPNNLDGWAGEMLYRDKRREVDLRAFSLCACLLVCFLALKFQNPAITGMCLTMCWPEGMKAIIEGN